MEFLERHIAYMRAPDVPPAPAPPALGKDEIRSAARETAEHIHAKSAELVAQLSQGIAGHLGVAFRHM